MTRFNPENKKTLTYGDCLDPIFKITDKEDALQYKQHYIEYLREKGVETPERVVNSNIGYYGGYGSENDRRRIEELFETSHPVFGSIEKNGRPTSEEAFKCGYENKTLSDVRKNTIGKTFLKGLKK